MKHTLSVYLMGVALGWITAEFVVGLLGGWLTAVIGAATLLLPNLVWIGVLVWKYQVKSWRWFKTKVIWSVLAAAFQFVLACVTYYAWIFAVETSMLNYSEAL